MQVAANYATAVPPSQSAAAAATAAQQIPAGGQQAAAALAAQGAAALTQQPGVMHVPYPPNATAATVQQFAAVNGQPTTIAL